MSKELLIYNFRNETTRKLIWNNLLKARKLNKNIIKYLTGINPAS